MAGKPQYENLEIADLTAFCRIVDLLEDPGASVKTYKAVEERLLRESQFTKVPPISNVSEKLSKISQRLYGEPGRLIQATKRTGDAVIRDEGRQLYAFAKTITQFIAKYKTEGSFEVNRTLTISCAMAFASRILPVLMADYLKDSFFRRISIQERAKVKDIFREVTHGAADIGICIDSEEHYLQQTELFRAGRGIMATEKFLKGKKFESSRDLANEVVVTFQPNTLQRIKMDDVFPEPGAQGVRIYAEAETTIQGWIASDVAIGHTYTGTLPVPPGSKYILSNLVDDKPEVRWYAYTTFPMSEATSDPKQKEIVRVIDCMKKKATKLQS